MRSSRLTSILLALSLLVTVVFVDGGQAMAQSVEDAEDAADDARRQAEVADGLVDDAVEARAGIEDELAASITRVNDLTAQLSIVGAGVDRMSEQLGFADVELAGIQDQIETQAVDAYMTVVGSPSVSLVNTESVEQAMVASSVVGSVVASGNEQVDALFIKKRSLEELQQDLVEQEEEYSRLQQEVQIEVDRLADLYAEADTAVADAVRASEQADADYREALSAVDLARAAAAERERQRQRSTTTTTSGNTTTTSGGTTSTSGGGNTTTTSGGGGGGKTWDHPPNVERWRSLVEKYFPPHRVEEALRIIRCESHGNPDAYNTYSGASGLFQFIPSTWASSSPKAGFPGASPFDPEANVGSAAWLGNRYEQLGHYFWRAWSCRTAVQ